MLKHTAVYWGAPASDGYGGWTYAGPREIACRWKDESVTFLTPAGREAVSKATIYVAEDLVLGGRLCHCELADLSSVAETPGDGQDTVEIMGLGKTWDISGKLPLRKVFVV